MRGRNVGTDVHHRQNVNFLQGDPGDRVALDPFCSPRFFCGLHSVNAEHIELRSRAEMRHTLGDQRCPRASCAT